MSKSKGRNRSSGANRTVRWSKPFLLPLPTESVHRYSLANHLALVAARAPGGDQHQVCQLIRLTYLSYFMWRKGVGSATLELYQRVEETLDQVSNRAVECGVWRLEASEVSNVTEIVRQVDEQIEQVSAKDFIQSESELEALLFSSQRSSPIPKSCR